MPKIPTYTATIDYQPPRGDLETAAMPGRMLAKFGESAGEFGGKIVRQVELAERMKQAAAEAARANGTAQAMAELRQTMADFDADTDPGSMMDRYLERAHRIYAIPNSRFGNAKRSLFHYPLPVRNVKNTELGYHLYDNNLIPGRAE